MFSSNSFGLLISGGRGFKDYNSFVTKVENLLSNVPQWDIHIITGDSEGTDEMARRYAVDFGCELHTFSTMWHEHEGKAVSERNVSMFKFLVQNFHHMGVLIMCDGEFNSEEQQINLAKYYKLPIRISKVHIVEFPSIQKVKPREFVSAPKWFQDDPNLSSYDKFLVRDRAQYQEALVRKGKYDRSQWDEMRDHWEYEEETPRQKRIRRKKLLARAAYFADMYGVWAVPEWAEQEVTK